jgi:putative restriction endonuclease
MQLGHQLMRPASSSCFNVLARRRDRARRVRENFAPSNRFVYHQDGNAELTSPSPPHGQLVTPRRPWTRDELMLALYLYVHIPFGRQDKGDLDVQQLAIRLGRTSSSVAMKLSNLTSLDPIERERGVKGLQSASRADSLLFAEYSANPLETLAIAETLWNSDWTPSEASAVWSSEMIDAVQSANARRTVPRIQSHEGPTDRWTEQKIRLGQRVFRRNVLAAYDERCAVTGMAVESLLTASHIKPWAMSEDVERVSPHNGLLLSPFYNAAFDKGLITLDDQLNWSFASKLLDACENPEIAHHVDVLRHRPLRVPTALYPAEEFIRFHREYIFQSE